MSSFASSFLCFREDSDASVSGTLPRPCAGGRRRSSDGHYLELPDPEVQVEYKKGWVMRKAVVDEDGKRSKSLRCPS